MLDFIITVDDQGWSGAIDARLLRRTAHEVIDRRRTEHTDAATGVRIFTPHSHAESQVWEVWLYGSVGSRRSGLIARVSLHDTHPLTRAGQGIYLGCALEVSEEVWPEFKSFATDFAQALRAKLNL